MARKRLFRFILLASIVSIVPGVSYAQEKEKPKSKSVSQKELMEMDRKAHKPPSGAGFYIAPIAEIPGRFSLMLSDQGGRFVSESFAENQIIIFEAILLEAKKFAQTDESVGSTKPVITRFFEKKEPSFIVDVAKMRNHSQFFITIKGLTGHITVDAGTVKRGDGNASPLLYAVLDRVQARNTTDK